MLFVTELKSWSNIGSTCSINFCHNSTSFYVEGHCSCSQESTKDHLHAFSCVKFQPVQSPLNPWLFAGRVGSGLQGSWETRPMTRVRMEVHQVKHTVQCTLYNAYQIGNIVKYFTTCHDICFKAWCSVVEVMSCLLMKYTCIMGSVWI